MAREIKIAGWQKVSLIDYPEKIASVIFIAGCNMCCHYCHNHHILDSRCNQIPLREVLDELLLTVNAQLIKLFLTLVRNVFESSQLHKVNKWGSPSASP